MELYQPQVSLFVRRNFDGPDEYILHALTYFPNISYQADGHRPVPAELDGDGAWVIGLKARHDPGLLSFNGPGPVAVVHTISLGSIPGEVEDVLVKAELWVEEGAKARNVAVGEEEKPKATSTVSTTSAGQPTRPIKEE